MTSLSGGGSRARARGLSLILILLAVLSWTHITPGLVLSSPTMALAAAAVLAGAGFSGALVGLAILAWRGGLTNT